MSVSPWAIVIVISFSSISNADHVVFFHHVATYSHIVATMPLAEALIDKGHKVTYISAVPTSSPNPNITFIVPSTLHELIKSTLDSDFDVTNRLDGTQSNSPLDYDRYSASFCEVVLSSNEFQLWINTTSKVDLIYVDSTPECVFGVSYKLQSKIAVFHTYVVTPRYYDSFGISDESSSIPGYTISPKTPLSFWDRVVNTLYTLGWRMNQNLNWPEMEEIIKKYLDIEDLPSIDEFYRNISIVMTNGHFLDEYRRSLPPMFVHVPGLHVRQGNQTLPKEIADFVDSKDELGNVSEGFVYISLGTVVKAPKLPQSIREVYFNSIAKYPRVRFLWRWDGKFPEDKPKNLLLSRWFNQQDLLSNPKIRGFVTQTGRPSTQEAIYNAVPTISFPILGDQDHNANLLEHYGVAINLEIADVSEEKLTEAFSTILYDKTVRERCVEFSQLYKDLPMKPIDTAVWWTEYILRHKNTDHLKPLAINQTWYERRLLDVWTFIALIGLTFLYILFHLLRLVLKVLADKLFSSKKLKQP